MPWRRLSWCWMVRQMRAKYQLKMVVQIGSLLASARDTESIANTVVAQFANVLNAEVRV